MKAYGVNELRNMFLGFFAKKCHLVKSSYSLVPQNDKSLLLINSGMAPLKAYFTGQEIPPSKRMATCQKCVRTGDIENVGKTARHLTFFEMLGNFSFGDYFKKEALEWSWEFLTQTVGMDPDRLYPSIFFEDEEAFEIWTKDIGVAPERVTRFYRDENGKSDNFWEHGAGPCGPSSEIYYDRGEAYGCGEPDCGVGCECDRYMEVWNDVFTQFDSDGKGHYTELDQKNIDTGMGLERLAVAVQGVDSVFEIDTMKKIRDKILELAGINEPKSGTELVSVRLITDHIRSATFLISDGVMPSNEGRGYVLRRLIRRGARHVRLLTAPGQDFLANLSKTVIDASKDGYPDLVDREDYIFQVLRQEEMKFNETIDQGLSILTQMQEDMKKKGSKTLSGENAFRLYDTYGFPLDLTKDILEENGYVLDEAGFLSSMEQQRIQAREARKTTNYMGADATVYDGIDPALETAFVGYDVTTYTSKISVLTTEKKMVEVLSEGEIGSILVDETPFYATSGGQEADTGLITYGENEFEVDTVIKLRGEKIAHVGKVVKGSFQVGDEVELAIDTERRDDTRKNHSATHLLQKALRMVLGNHVEQQGSFVNMDRLRFDFSHFAALSPEEITKVEDIVNAKIEEALPVSTDVMEIEEARQAGAMALFGEKYGDMVRVVSMGEYSKELCGGTHVYNTGNIGAFKIISETGIAAGVRRIEALTGPGVFKYYRGVEDILKEAAKLAKTTTDGLGQKITQLLGEIKSLQSENESLKSKVAKDALGDVMDQVQEIKGVKVLATTVSGVDMNGLRDLGDQLKEKLGEGVVVLISEKEGKVSLITMATEEAQRQGVHAGNLIKALAPKVGGGGGGRPNMAQAGGKNPAGIPEALSEVAKILETEIKS